MKPLFLAISVLFLASCSKDEPKTCSISDIDAKTYTGQIGVCMSQSQFVEFDGAATFTLQDSIYQIELYSTDPLHTFSKLYYASCTCQVLDDDIKWDLVDVNHDNELGSVYGDGKFILLDLLQGPCGEDQFFLGAIQD